MTEKRGPVTLTRLKKDDRPEPRGLLDASSWSCNVETLRKLSQTFDKRRSLTVEEDVVAQSVLSGLGLEEKRRLFLKESTTETR